ncbi:MAG: trypsin-like serine protease [Gammaproteobacteria bacterium]|nr:MAG: trypsin-like serine protease [Gammaproteobacteria bacterium]
MKKTIIFILQSGIAGLAIAFLVLLFLGKFEGKKTAFDPRNNDNSSYLGGRETIASLQAGFSHAVRQAAPAVVYIYTARLITERPHPFLRDKMFREFFASDDDSPRQRLETGLGSGVIVSPQGYILTNNHVIEGADQIQVQLADGRGGIARIVGTDPETDLAVLQVAIENLPVIRIGQSTHLNVGDVVLAIGNPFNVGQTVTMGIVSATGRSELGVTTFENFIQTDATINPGNSGGALVNIHGEMIGINTAIFSNMGANSPSAQGIGFAIPVKLAKDIMQQIIAQGYITRGWLGIEVQDMDPRLAYALDLPISEGAVVRSVQSDGPAEQAGLKTGDILLAIQGNPIRSAKEALIRIVRAVPGEKVILKVWRAGEERDLVAKPSQRPSSN